MQGRGYESRLHKYYLKLKFDDFKQTTIEQPIQKKLSDEVFVALLEQAYARVKRPVRLIGVGFRLTNPAPSQLVLPFQ